MADLIGHLSSRGVMGASLSASLRENVFCGKKRF